MRAAILGLTLEAAYRSLSLVDAMTNQAEAISRTVLTVDTSVNRDTALDFTTARVERHPGDRVNVPRSISTTAATSSWASPSTSRLLQDLLWVGCGRDVQVTANYWYFGVNPLALTGLFRQ